MKLQKKVLFFILLCLLSCNKRNNDITINGKILGNLPEKVEYTVPVNGTWFYGTKESVVPDSLGNFQITMNSANPSITTLYIPGAQGVLLVENSHTYEVVFDLGKTKNKFTVLGDNSEALNLYNTFLKPEFNVYNEANRLMKGLSISSLSSGLKMERAKEIEGFKKLLEQGEISKGFYEWVVIDRTCYYSALEGVAYQLMYPNQTGREIENQKLEITKLWGKTFDEAPTNDPNFVSSPWFYSLAENYLNYHRITQKSFDKDEVLKNDAQEKKHTHHIHEAKKYLKGIGLEYYIASYIFYNCWQNKDNPKELITLLEQFKKEYPTSEYTQYLTTAITPIVAFHDKVVETKTNDKIQIIDNSENINDFVELMTTLKGKKVFVDIWGTWCAPCKREFAHKNDLTQLLKSKGIETLYICEGRNSKEEVWKEMIKFYDLEGHHILANKNLVTNIIKRFERNGPFAYPRYLLIDENGIVVNEEASYPSNIKELEKEIQEDYKW